MPTLTEEQRSRLALHLNRFLPQMHGAKKLEELNNSPALISYLNLAAELNPVFAPRPRLEPTQKKSASTSHIDNLVRLLAAVATGGAPNIDAKKLLIDLAPLASDVEAQAAVDCSEAITNDPDNEPAYRNDSSSVHDVCLLYNDERSLVTMAQIGKVADLTNQQKATFSSALQQLEQQFKSMISPKPAPGTSVAEEKEKLWQGFSKYAQQATSTEQFAKVAEMFFPGADNKLIGELTDTQQTMQSASSKVSALTNTSRQLEASAPYSAAQDAIKKLESLFSGAKPNSASAASANSKPQENSGQTQEQSQSLFTLKPPTPLKEAK